MTIKCHTRGLARTPGNLTIVTGTGAEARGDAPTELNNPLFDFGVAEYFSLFKIT